MWGAPYNQQQPPPGGPPLQPGMPPPRGGSWDNSQSGYGNDDHDQQGSALNSAVDLVASAASNIFAYGSRQQQQQKPPPMDDPYRTPGQAPPPPRGPHGSAQPSPQQPPRPIQPTSSLLSTAPRTPIQQPAPIQVDSSLISSSGRLAPAAPPMGMTTPVAPNGASGPPPMAASSRPPPMTTSSGPPPMAASSRPPPMTTSSGPPPIPATSGPPQSMAAASGNRTTASRPTEESAAASLSSAKPPYASSPIAPSKATVASNPPAPSTSAPTADAPAPATPQQASKPLASLSPRSGSTKKLPLPPPSSTLKRPKRAPKFKLPPTYKSTTPTSTPTSTKDKVSISGSKSTSTPTTPRTTTSNVSGAPPVPSTPTAEPSVSDATPKVNNTEQSPKVLTPQQQQQQQQQPAMAVPMAAPATTEAQMPSALPLTEPQPPKESALGVPAPVPAPPSSKPPAQSEGGTAKAKALPPGWVELIHESSGQSYYWNEKDNVTTWERPVAEVKEASVPPTASALEPADESRPPPLDQTIPATTKADQPETMTEDANQLPEGWIEVVDEASGSTYFVNTLDNTTSWSRPSVNDLVMDTPVKHPVQPEQAPEEKEEAAPSHQQHGGDEGTGDVPLPPGWVELKDEASGRSYYVHEGDNNTTWERPCAPPANTEEKPEAAGNETVEELYPAEEHRRPEVTLEQTSGSMDDDVPTSPAAADTTMAILGDMQEPEKPLAPGWTEVHDPNSGRKYYVNEADNSRTWERPVAQADDRPVSDMPAVNDQTVNSEAEPEQLRAAPEVAGEHEEGVPAPEVTESSAGETEGAAAEAGQDRAEQATSKALPSGWIEAFDPQSGAPYYFNAETHETRWKPPSPSPEADRKASNEDDSEGFVMVDKPEGQDMTAPEMTSESSREKSVSASQGENESSALAPGWKEMKDPSTGKLFYVNEAQNRTVWEKPLLETASIASSAPDATVDGAETDLGLVHEVIEEEAVDGQDDTPRSTIDNSAGALPPGWEEMIDPNTKVTFYYNEAEGRSSWERPATLPESVPEQKSPTRHTTMDELNADVSETQFAATFPGEVDDRQEPPELVSGDSHETEDEAGTGKLLEATSDLAPGWIEATDPLSGRVYYLNEKEGTSSWERPVAEPGLSVGKDQTESGANEEKDVDTPELTAAAAVEHSQATTGKSSGGVAEELEEDLPPGWVAVDDPTTGSIFYFNEMEQRTSYEKPSRLRSTTEVAPQGPVEPTGPTEEQLELPPGWVESVDPSTGRPFYFNEAEGKSSWERPVLKSSEKGNDDTEENDANEFATISATAAPASPPDEPEGTPQAVEFDRALSTDLELPPGWVESVDPATGSTFYFNQTDGVSSWERPRPLDDDIVVHEEEEEPIDSELPEMSPDQDRTEPPRDHPEETPQAGDPSTEPSAETTLPPGWAESVDPETGNTFYFNEVSGESSWERPTMTAEGDPGDEIKDEPVVEYAAEDEPTMTPDEVVAETMQDQPMDSSEQETQPEQLAETQPSQESVVAPPVESELPPGWAESVDPATGSIFYFNAAEGKSSWERPTLSAEGVMAQETKNEPVVEYAAEDDPILTPEKGASETTQDPPMDSNEQETQPEQLADTQPREESDLAPPVESELPPGWAESVDPATGSIFYFNAAEGKSSWERPTLSAEGVMAQETKNEPVVEYAAEDDPILTPEKGASETTQDPPMDSNEQETQPEQLADTQPREESDLAPPVELELPPGWAQSVDPATGNTFYFNEVSGESSWEKPTVTAEGDLGDEIIDEPVVESAAEVEPTMTPDEVVAETMQDQPMDSSEQETEPTQPRERSDVVPPVESELPPGWAESVDPATGNIFYFNEVIGESSWERPPLTSEENVADDAGDEALADPNLAQEESAQRIPSGQPPEEKPVGESVSELPPGWIEAVDPASGATYYFNEIDNVSAWERPTGIPDEAASPAEIEKSEEALGEPELPPGWIRVVDPSSGDAYFVNETTNETSWKRPSLAPSEEVLNNMAISPTSATGAEESATPEVVGEDAREELAESLGIGAEQGVTEEVIGVEPTEELAGSDQVAVQLPPGWTQAVDPSTGKVYYVNHTKNITTWDPPVVEGQLSEPIAPAVEGDIGPGNNPLQSSGELDDPSPSAEAAEPEIVGSDLPAVEDNALAPGWTEAVDSSSGKTYFFNESTNETSWERPILARSEDSSGQVDTPLNEDMLAPGWEELIDPNGEVYYYNRTLDQTQWERPVTPAHVPHGRGDISAEKSEIEKSQAQVSRMRPGHAFATFGFGGQLCVWRFSAETECKPVGIHRISELVPTHELVQAEATKQELGILGPLDGADSLAVKTYMNKQTEEKPKDLLWQLFRIVSASKGKLRSEAGVSDPRSPESAVIDLLLKEGENITADPQKELNGIPGPVQSLEQERNGNGRHSDKSKLEMIQNLILRGKREAAVELAIGSNNYALALLVGAYCNDETYHRVTKQFAENVLRSGSPLYTITMLFSHQALDSSMWSESSSELLSSWPYHLAAIISNRTQGWERVIFTLGTRLQQLGDMNSAHFCYMVCGLQLSSPTLPHTYVSLLGCDHLMPEAMSLMTAEGIEAFGRTEAYEWAKRRGNRSAVVKTLQPFKLYYAMLLADVGYVDLAKKYLESILRMCELEGDVSRFDCTTPIRTTLPEMCESFEAFKTALGDFEQRLFRSFPILTPVGTKEPVLPIVEETSPQTDSLPAQGEMFNDLTSPTKSSESDMTFMTAATHLQDTAVADVPSKSKKKDSGPKLARVKRNQPKSAADGAGETPKRDPIPSAPQSGPPSTHVQSAPPSQFETPAAQKPPSSTAPATEKKAPGRSPGGKKPDPSPKSAPAVMSQSKKGGWLAGIRETITKKLNPDATTADIGESMQAYFDEDKKVWVFPGEDPAEVSKPLPPPPTPMSMTQNKEEEKPKPDMANDPLAAMMAPPQRTPATLARSRASGGGGGGGGGGGVPPTPRSLYGGMPGMPGAATPGTLQPPVSAGGTPQFMVFQPKPEQTAATAAAEEKTEPEDQ